MSCLTAEQLEALSRGLLTDQAASPLLEHLKRCENCRNRLAEYHPANCLWDALQSAPPVDLQEASSVETVPGFHETRRRVDDQATTERRQSGRHEAVDEPSFSLPSEAFVGYQIIREIHRGGQGVVYQAVQKSTKRRVAIKVMKEGPFASKAELARFEREVEILGQLNHPHIVAIHDSDQVAGRFYYVMDYISGQPLDAWISSGPRSIEETLRLFQKICEAVNAAHLRGIIHRDLKPGNIRIDENGEPHILDFGLAKVARGVEEGSMMTLTGQFMGSLPWASPEQAEACPSKIDIRTDVYSLGVILYQMLTGQFPYEVAGNMRDVLDQIMRAEPARPSSIRVAASVPQGQSRSRHLRRSSHSGRIDDEVDTITLRCLAKERERRYQSAGELARDIGHYLSGEPIEAKRDSALYVLRKQLRRYRLPATVAAAFVVLISAALIASLTLWRQTRIERDRAERLFEYNLEQNAIMRAVEIDRREAAYRTIVQSNPKSAVAWSCLGEALLDAKRYGEAEEAMREAVSLDDSLAAAHAGLGEVLLAQGRDSQAETAFLEAIDREPHMGAAWYGLDAVLVRQKRLSDANQSRLRAASIAPGILKSCPACRGAGIVPCMNCNGTGSCQAPPKACVYCGGTGRKTCPHCVGTGKRICATCKGVGEVKVMRRDEESDAMHWELTRCSRCNGTGEVKCQSCDDGWQKCSTCKGTGLRGGRSRHCESCDGCGTVLCVRCRGTGHWEEAR